MSHKNFDSIPINLKSLNPSSTNLSKNLNNEKETEIKKLQQPKKMDDYIGKEVSKLELLVLNFRLV